MWWSRPLIVLLILALGPVGCGFRPLYGKSGAEAESGGSDLANIYIDRIDDRIGQQLRNSLLQRLTPRGEPASPDYVLTIKLSQSLSDLGYRKDSFATLGRMVLTAQIGLSAGRRTILSDASTAIANFDYLGPRYASVAMERDAESRAIEQLADDIRSRAAIAIKQYKANPNDPKYRIRRSPLDDVDDMDAKPRPSRLMEQQ
ncbi:Predicted secreted protein [Candidatus Terasakiella magnetica]|nr:Predicted secreted protein [Candidatus Terasakiella magnetica]